MDAQAHSLSRRIVCLVRSLLRLGRGAFAPELFVLAGALAAASGEAISLEPGAPQIAYPEGYRFWTHVKSQIATQGRSRAESIGGVHHIYANELAMAGYRSGKFPEGSIIVFDLLEAQETKDSILEGPRRWIGVMVKDKRHVRTEGWGYDKFAGNSHSDRNVPVNGPIGNCYSCHLQEKTSDFVFSKFRD